MTICSWRTETLVNTTTAGAQREPSVATLNDAGYVIAWSDFGTTPASIKIQIFNTDDSARTGNYSGQLF